MPVLAAGERQIDQVLANCGGARGTLYLTDRRLIFEHSQGLPFVNRKSSQLGISLGQIQSVSAKHGHFGAKEIIITAKDANNGFKSNCIAIGIALHPEVWITKINNMLTAITAAYQPSISLQRATLVEREVVKIPCKYCGTLNDLVRNKNCSQCGAPVYKG